MLGIRGLHHRPEACCNTHLAMALPAKLQHSILSWVGNDTIASTSLKVSSDEDVLYGINDVDPTLSPMDLFSLSDAAAAAGSPCVVIKDNFLGREKAFGVHKGEFQ